MTNKATLLAITTLLAAASANADTTFTPAKFDFSGDTVASAITVNSATANIAIYCQSDIAAGGQNLKTQCFEKDGDHNLQEQVTQTISSLSFKPASIEGENVAVRMNYRVIIQKDSDSQSALLIPNLGSLQSRLGVNYIEPQEQIKAGWFRQVSSQLEDANSFFKQEKTLVRAKATISTDGTPASVKLIDNTSPTQTTLMKTALSQAAFIPGFVDGKATEMPYLAVVTR